MSDVEARILGAADVITVKGVDYKLAPLSLQQLAEVQRRALRSFKNNYIATFKDNIDIFPEKQRVELLVQKLDEVGRWDINDLPSRTTYDVQKVNINKAIKDKVLTFFEDDQVQGWQEWNDQKWRAILGALVDSGQITPETVKQLTKSSPRTIKIPYDMWWVTAAYEGMLILVSESLKINQPELTQAEVNKWPIPDIMGAARMVEQITAPAWGNT